MCGIAGILATATPNPDITVDRLTAMSDAIAHRGPDDSGTWISSDGRVGFGFRRLSIVDLSPAGHQPMSTPDGDVTVVFNGEIYNHLALRAELEPRGYVYRSRSDTESLLYAYRAWGERFVERLHGMFAVAVWDARARRLVLCRDRIGVKPLYYAVRDGRLLFASEIKALLAHPSMRAEIDEEALRHFLTFIHTPAPLTLFRGVRKLEPGHRLVVTADGAMRDESYWEPWNAPPPDVDFRDEEAVADRIRTLFSRAVERRMMSDVPFGVFLSGGIDSSANVAFMAKLMTRPVDTFTVAIAGQEETNELAWARRVAERYGAARHEVVISDGGFLDLLPTVVRHQDEPLADPVCFPLFHVSKLARDNGTIVVQVGEGSDEQFAGYRNYLLAARLTAHAGWVRHVPRVLRAAAYGAVAPLLALKRYDARQNYLRNLVDGEPVFWSNAVAFYEREKRRLMSAAFRARVGSESSYAYVAARLAALRAARPAEPLDEIVDWEIRNRLAELLLMRVDKISMANSIEARVPFLDHELVEFTLRIPAALKTKGGMPKYVLKRALRGVLPDEIVDRPKIGFAGSGKNMLTPAIFAHAKRLVLDARHDYFDRRYLEDLFSLYERRRVNVTPQIWALYNFELWHRMWIEGRRFD